MQGRVGEGSPLIGARSRRVLVVVVGWRVVLVVEVVVEEVVVGSAAGSRQRGSDRHDHLRVRERIAGT